ncbi:hypothetical protein TWF694_007207 [Orbilia ellipsospora]|uniref:Uncharacterized protein n=1 Tax=Orbilia ellipsospora TaxID=2528407 RepID=A0AAV9XHZ3_9PEZI
MHFIIRFTFTLALFQISLGTPHPSYLHHHNSKRDGSAAGESDQGIDISSAELNCQRQPATGVHGANFYDLWTYIQNHTNDLNIYIIDKEGCFQIDCVSVYAAVRLCNYKEKPSYTSYTSFQILEALRRLMNTWWTQAGHLAWVVQDPTHYGMIDGKQYWDTSILNGGDCGDQYANGQPRDLNTPGEKMEGSVRGDGWDIVLEAAPGKMKCDIGDNFVTGACRKDDSCSWDYDEPISYF